MAGNLAGRGTRLLSVIIDTVVGVGPSFLIIGPAIQAGMAGQMATPPAGALGALINIYGLVILLVQLLLLIKKGQTIGKMVTKIKIVKVSDGSNGGFVTNVLLRSIVGCLLWIIPFYILVDILFIFRGDRRCIHDLIAGTQVVAA